MKKITILTALAVLLAAVLVLGCDQPETPPAENMTVYFIDVGQGDSMLLTMGGESLLIDGGTSEYGGAVSEFLTAHGVSTIDTVVLTHPHEDHVGGLVTLMREHPVENVIDSGHSHTSQSYAEFLNLTYAKNAKYVIAYAGYRINFSPDVTIEVLSPPIAGRSPGILNDNINDNSIVFRLTYKNVSFLFTGDAGQDAETQMLRACLLSDIDILKVAHHGSQYSTGGEFLMTVRPEVSIIEVGPNSYGHPSSSTIKKLKVFGDVYSTRGNGNIIITTDGKVYTVKTESGNALIETPDYTV